MSATHPLPERLHQRLAALADSLARRDDAWGLLGLGSVGADTARADAWSDLDFFVLVAPGAKARYLDRLDWLAEAHPLVWSFANTRDGHKALMADGLLCEFAVFEPDELAGVPYTPGRWVWRRAARVPEAWAAPQVPLPTPRGAECLADEALSNLIVGLLRWHRGERVAALRMVQVYAVDRVLELADLRALGAGGWAPRDPFDAARRAEFRHPDLAALLPRLMPGLDGTPAAALALLAHLESFSAVPAAVATHIRALAR